MRPLVNRVGKDSCRCTGFSTLFFCYGGWEAGMKRTPLYKEHVALGARMVPFGEWEMPERYTSIIEEHRATRTAAGLFDLSHMGEFYISGAAATDLVQYLVTNDISALPL